MNDPVVYSVERDQKTLEAFKKMMECDEHIGSHKNDKKAILNKLADELDVEKKSLSDAYKMFIKSLEGNDKIVEASEAAVNIANRLNNIVGQQ